MPSKMPGESKDEFISRCIAKEINHGMEPDQAAAACYNIWNEFEVVGATPSYNEPAVSVNFALGERVSFDWDGTLSTRRGQELAKKEISEGSVVYIITARDSIDDNIRTIADSLMIPNSRIYAVGSNRAKVEKIRELRIRKHYDNNIQVVRELPRIGIRFFKDRILFSADADKDLIKSYLDAHYEVEILAEGNLSSQSPKALLMSKELNVPVVYKRKGEYELDFTEGDPMMSYLKRKGKKYKKSQVLKSVALENGFDLRKVAEVELELKKEVDLKFIRVETKFSYEERPGVAPAASGSRPFCKSIIAANKMFSLEEIQAMVGIGFRGNLPVGAQAVADPFLFTGGVV